MLETIGRELNRPVEFCPGSINMSSSEVFQRLPEVIPLYGNLFVAKKVDERDDLTSYIYRIPSRRAYNLRKEEPVLAEARGTVFSDAGIRARPFPIFGYDPPSEYIYRETSIKVDGRGFFGIFPPSGEVLFYTKSGRALKTIRHKGCDSLTRHSFQYGLTPLFEEVPQKGLGCIREQPGIYLVGLRSISTGRLLPYRYLVQLAEKYNLVPPTVLSSDVKLESFIANARCEGVITLFVDTKGNQYISRWKTKFYQEIVPWISYLRYGRNFPMFYEALMRSSDLPFDIGLEPKELLLLKYIRDLVGKGTDSDLIKKRAKAKRRKLMKND